MSEKMSDLAIALRGHIHEIADEILAADVASLRTYNADNVVAHEAALVALHVLRGVRTELQRAFVVEAVLHNGRKRLRSSIEGAKRAGNVAIAERLEQIARTL